MSPVTRVQEVAIFIVVLAAVTIVAAAPFAILGVGAGWRARVSTALVVLEALVVAARRILGI